MQRKTVLISLVAPLLLTYCGQNSPRSATSAELKDVVNPGDMGDSNTLYWIDQDQVGKGECLVGSAPSRENCQKNLVKAPLADTTKRATDAYATRSAAIQAQIIAEVNALKAADPTVKELTVVVNALTAQKAELEKAVAAGDATIATKTTQKTGFEKSLAFVNSQLVEIEKALVATPNDQSLMKLKMDRLDEKQELTTSIATLTEELARMTASVQWYKAELEGCKKSLAETSAKLKAVYDALNVASAKLDSLKVQEKFTKDSSMEVAGIVSMLKMASITFKGNLFSAEKQDALKAFSDSIVVPAVIKEGRYTAISGHTSYCPQRLQTKSVNGVLDSVTTTYLSPCGGSSDSFKCSGKICKSSQRAVTILSQTQYEYAGPNKAIFEFQSPSLDADVTPNGPHESL